MFVTGPTEGTIKVQLQDNNGHVVIDTLSADSSGRTTTSKLNIANSSLIEGMISVFVEFTDSNGGAQPIFKGSNAVFDKTMPKA